jgi:excisionase family DNA binding protein
MDSERLLDRAMVRGRLGISDRTLGREMKSGKLRYLRVGRQIRFLPEHVDAYIRAAEEKTAQIPRARRKRGAA